MRNCAPNSRLPPLLALFALGFSGLGMAADAPTADPQSKGPSREQFEQSLHFQTGEIKLKDGLATLRLPPEFRYLNPADTERVLTQAWGNPKGDGTLGMIVPSDTSPVANDAWAVIVSFEEDGYVPDQDADTIKYDELLKKMQEDGKASNEARAKDGFDPIELIGWAEPPRYDKSAHKMYWAKELKVGNAEQHTLNYNIRVLGRRGVLVLNAVAGMEQLDLIRQRTPGILAATDFNPGHSYGDFNASTDKLAAYGLAALVAGGIAAKTGLLAKLIGLLIVGKKIIALGVVAAIAAFRKFFQRKPTTGA